MRKRALEFLKCFNCGGEFGIQNEVMEGDHVVSGNLVCNGCGYTAPISSGIPRMLPTDLSAENKDIADRFGYEWKNFADFFDDTTRIYLNR